MKSKRIQFTLVCLILGGNLFSQKSLDSLLIRVERNNPAVMAAYQYYENVRVGSRTNLYPENPVIQYGHLWGSPQSLGNRTDFSVSQSFYFPSVYVNRSRLSRSELDKAVHVLQSVRLETLLKAQQQWIEMVYQNKRQMALERRMEEAEQVVDYFQKQKDMGEISQLSLNKVVLLKASLLAEGNKLSAEQTSLLTEILYLTGGQPSPVQDSVYYPVEKTILDSVFQTSLSDPLYKAHQYDVDRLNLQRKLTRSSGLPKIKTAYYSESIMDEKLKGFQLGLSIPLWENANKVKYASGAIISAEMERDRFRSGEEANIVKLYAHLESSRKQMMQLNSALESTNDPKLLAVAVESGEISLMEYFFETELYYRVFNDFLAAEKEFYQVEAELSKYDL